MKRAYRFTAVLLAVSVLLMVCIPSGFADSSEVYATLTTMAPPTKAPKPTKTPKPTQTPKPTKEPKTTATPELASTPEPAAEVETTTTPEPEKATPLLTPLPGPLTEQPQDTATEMPALNPEEDDFVPPSPEPPDPAKQGHPTPGPTEAPTQTVIDHINYPKVLRDFRFQRDAKLLEIWFPNIRDADAAILTFEGQVFMIDCGDERAANRTAVLLRQLGIEKIDVIFNSHLHHDHINGLAITDDTARVSEVKICFPINSTTSGEKLAAVAAQRSIPVTEFQSGDWFTMGENGEVTLLFLRNYDPMMDINNESAQTIVRYKNRSILFTADMEKNGQAQMLKHVDPSLFKCDIIKYPHHGKSAMYEDFYYAVGAKLAVVTSVQGRKDAGQAYLVAKKQPAAYTSTKGKFVHLVTDGNYWLCEYVSSNGK